ncbi:DUF4625 domain-containing protein [Carboxylicivirga caseinilyticus]|uniref:DUF4625 domain-containing protein n=1 Tax=Carboxylicivirga caseinilyticus TaxID=3417572 RepID=UPI003D346D3D|nr:DUF4625 domain-containing protein [Marinilabiliaceae bacterium A049]
MKKLINVLTLSLLVSLLISCKKSEDPKPDTEAPTIEFVKPVSNGSTSYSRGLPMDLSATFKDNSALSECVVTISYHATSTSNVLKGIGSPWAPAETGEQFVISFNGEKEKVVSTNLFEDDIEIACLSGNYTLTFVVTDKSLNKYTTTVDITLE